MRAALVAVWGPDAVDEDGETYIAANAPAPGLHLYAFHDARDAYDEYEVILIREPEVDGDAAGRAWGPVAGSVYNVLRAIEAARTNGTARRSEPNRD